MKLKRFLIRLSLGMAVFSTLKGLWILSGGNITSNGVGIFMLIVAVIMFLTWYLLSDPFLYAESLPPVSDLPQNCTFLTHSMADFPGNDMQLKGRFIAIVSAGGRKFAVTFKGHNSLPPFFKIDNNGMIIELKLKSLNA